MATIDKIRLNGTEYTIVDGTKYTKEEVNAAITAATSALSDSIDDVLDGYVTNDELAAYAYDKDAVDGKLATKVDTTAFTQYQGEITSKFGEKVDTTAFTQYQGEITSKLGEKVDVTAFTEYKGEVAAELADKLEAADIAEFFDGATYNDSTKNIEFTHEGTVKATVSALPFIKDGMIDSVKIEGGKLVITWNADAGKEVTELEITDIFDASNYYSKEAADKQFGTLAEQTQLRSDVEDLMGEVATLEADKADKTELEDVRKQIPGEYVKSVEFSQGSIDTLTFRDKNGQPNVYVEFATINGITVAYHNNFELVEQWRLEQEYYSKALTDAYFVKKVDIREEIKPYLDERLEYKADKGESYTKAESDAKYAPKATVEGTTLILG